MQPSSGDGSDSEDQLELIAAMMRRFFQFCTSDPVRYQLLFQRTITDFTPSKESFAVAQQAYDISLAPLRRLGLAGSELDLKQDVTINGYPVAKGKTGTGSVVEPDGTRSTASPPSVGLLVLLI